MKFVDIKTRDETKKQINEEFVSIYQKKIDLYNTILERMNINYKKSDSLFEHKQILLNPENLKPENYNIKYELVDDLAIAPVLGELNAYIPNFMFDLWKLPKVVCKLLLSANVKDMKEHLSNLFCNNFYENILSPNYIENNLLFLITLLLNEDINNIEKKKIEEPYKCLDYFLKDSPCSFILEQFHKKKDVQIFFKTILLNIIENLELSYSNKEMIFDWSKIAEEINNKNKNRKNSHDKLDQKIIQPNLSISFINVSIGNEFYDKNIFTINSEYFRNLLADYKNDEKMAGYLLYYMGESDTTKNKFSPELFIQKNIDDNFNQEIISEYGKNYDKTIELINELFENLKNYLYLLPYSIKCICKIIISLISKKYKRFNIFHQYAFISKFFFGKLFSPIFENPGLGAFINSFIISTQTIKNLELIQKIINVFVSGNLFKNSKEEENYTPFNSYFLTKMPELFRFFEEVIKVELPSFIEQFIEGKLPEDYEYNYFRENTKEVVFHKSTCFTVDDLYLLIDLMEKNKKNIFYDKENMLLNKLEKTFEKLSSKKNKEIIKKLKNNPEYEIIQVPVYHKKKKEIIDYKKSKGRQIIKYYLVSEICLNEKYSLIFDIKQNTKYFNLPELQKMNTNEENMENNIIKVKNFFCIILYNYRMLVKTDFKEENLSNIMDLLTELKQFMKSSNNVIDGNFPSLWYINSLLDYLNIIPKTYIEDDCEFLIKELKNDINKSMKILNFEELSVLIDKMKFSNRGKIYYENAKNLIIDIYLNKKAQLIVEKEPIEVEILMKYNEKNKELKIEPPNKNEKHLNFLDNVFEEPKKKPSKLCSTIKIFTKNFPDLIKYQNYYKVHVFQIVKELNVQKKINNYLKMIQNHLKNKLNITDVKEFTDINDKITDYIMEKLYDKIFPKRSNEMDEKIFKNCEKLSWVEPKHFISGKNNYVYNSFLPELTNYLMRIIKEKSVRKKIINTKSIFKCMDNLGKFNGEGKFGIDDQMKILNYVLIKAKPSRMYANCQFMELFIGKNNEGIEGQNLAELKAICEHVSYFSEKELIDVTEEEFKKNCENAKKRTSSKFEEDIII